MDTHTDSRRSVVQHEYELDGSDTLCQAITDAVSSAERVDATDLDPLYETIDIGALSRLFAPTAAGVARTGRVEFQYHGYDITVEVFFDHVTVAVDSIAASHPSPATANGDFSGDETDTVL